MNAVFKINGAPGAHISEDGGTIFVCVRIGVAQVCASFFSILLWLYVRGMHSQVPGCTDANPLHLAGAQTKGLISNTAMVYT